jgi:hypothetical protein
MVIGRQGEVQWESPKLGTPGGSDFYGRTLSAIHTTLGKMRAYFSNAVTQPHLRQL